MLYKTPSHLSLLAPPVMLAKRCANVIQLDMFKQQAGERWPRICEGVYAKLEGLLRGMLGPADFFARIEDFAYLVVMPTTEPEDVSVTCLRVAYDLHASFLGQCDIEHIEVGVAQASTESDSLLLENIPVERIRSLADKAGIEFVASKPVTRPHTHQSTAHPHTHQCTAPIPHRHAVLYPGGLTQPINPGPTDFQIEHHFMPIWSVQNTAVTTYLCETKEVRVPNRRDNIPLHALTPIERQEIDLSCFTTGCAQLADALRVGKPFLLALGLTFDVLGSPAWRKEIIGALHNLDQSFRQYLSFTIIDIPHGVAQTRLATMVTLLKPFGRSVSATVSPLAKDYTAYQGIGLMSVGYALRDFGPALAPSKHEIERLALFARRNGLLTFLADIKNVNVLKHAQDAGIHFLSGPAVAPTCDKPNGMWRLTWKKLMSESLVELWV